MGHAYQKCTAGNQKMIKIMTMNEQGRKTFPPDASPASKTLGKFRNFLKKRPVPEKKKLKEAKFRTAFECAHKNPQKYRLRGSNRATRWRFI